MTARIGLTAYFRDDPPTDAITAWLAERGLFGETREPVVPLYGATVSVEVMCTREEAAEFTDRFSPAGTTKIPLIE